MKSGFPNTLSLHTKIFYTVRAQSHVTLAVFDPLGRLIATLVNEVQRHGKKAVNFNTTGLAGGEYWYQLSVRPVGVNAKSKGHTQKKKLFLQQ